MQTILTNPTHLLQYKMADVGAQLFFCAGACGAIFVVSGRAGMAEIAMAEILFYGIIGVGLLQCVSWLIHHFAPKHFQLLQHRKYYIFLVLTYMLLQVAFYFIQQVRAYPVEVGITVFLSALPVGFYYIWLSLQELKSLRMA